jgi:hypothetical protein
MFNIFYRFFRLNSEQTEETGVDIFNITIVETPAEKSLELSTSNKSQKKPLPGLSILQTN